MALIKGLTQRSKKMTNKEKLIDALKRAGYEKVGDRFRIKYWIGVNTYQEAYEKKGRPNVFCFENDNELKIHNKRGTHRIDDIVSVTDV